MENNHAALAPLPRLYSIKQASELTGLSPGIIRKAVTRGDLKAYSPGARNRYRLRHEDLLAWLDSTEYQPEAEQSDTDETTT